MIEKWEEHKKRQEAKSVSRRINKDIAREKRRLKHERKSNLIPLDMFLTGKCMGVFLFQSIRLAQCLHV